MPTVSDAMITEHKSTNSDASVGEVRELFVDDKVHAALLVRDGELRSVVIRADLDGANDEASAAPLGQLGSRVIAADADHDLTLDHMQRTGQRRLAVVDADGRLLGLLCLKRSGAGFCTHADLAARRADVRRHST